jgi:hypothetical protein
MGIEEVNVSFWHELRKNVLQTLSIVDYNLVDKAIQNVLEEEL